MKKFIAILVLMILPIVVNAQVKRSIHVETAGTLPDLISEDEKYQIEELTLSGELNGTDIRLIRDMAGINTREEWRSDYHSGYYIDYTTEGKLSLIDISNAKIVSGGSAFYETGRWDYAEDVTPSRYFTIDNCIEMNMFYGCKFNTIELPGSITSIGVCSFSDCKNLTSITLPNGVSRIDMSAFSGCGKLTSITIPNSVTYIGRYAFNGTAWYNNQPNGILYFDNCLLGYKGDTKPSGVIEIKEGTRLIADNAFCFCSGLTTVTIPKSVTSINNNAFWGCSGLTSVTIPNGVKSIGYNTFYNCCGLVYISLSSKLESIGIGAFDDCDNLTDIYCYSENVPSAYVNSFPNPENITLHVPENSIESYKSTEPWDNFKEYVPLTNSDIQATERCSKPTISLVDGKITFNCETPEVTYHWNVSCPSGISGSSSNIQPITLNVYATKSGYQNSYVATYVFPGLDGDVDGNGVVNVVDHVKLTEIIMKP